MVSARFKERTACVRGEFQIDYATKFYLCCIGSFLGELFTNVNVEMRAPTHPGKLL